MNYTRDTSKPKAKSVFLVRGIKLTHEWYKTDTWINRQEPRTQL